MRRSSCAAIAAAMLFVVFAEAATAKVAARDRLDAYTAVVQAGQLAMLAEQGFDATGQREVAGGIEVGLVLTKHQRAKLARDGVRTQLTRVQGGLTVQEFAARQALAGFTVWRSYDEPGGFRDQMYALADRHRGIAKLVRLGTTIQGREILAIKLTAGARGVRDGRRPAVLYSSVQHAREWIAGETNRRLMNWYVDRWRAEDPAIKDLLETTELWFVLVANPDGYQYTHDGDRLWRKNMRNNDGDPAHSIADGVDPNRNWPSHFKYDEEGSSSIFSSETYRGTAPASEAETQALKGLLDRVGFEFHVNYHSVGEWLLYAEGWQIATPTADDPIYFALSGNLDRPAIPGFHPGLSSDVLYVTNGETTDYAHATTGALAWTPELGDGCPTTDCGFVFPDDEAEVQKEFERNLPFALSVAKSADDPDDPDSSLGIQTKPLYVKSDDPYKDGLPGANFTFKHSYGDPQPVRVVAKRSLGAVDVKYRINGGATQTRTTQEWGGGERFSPADVHYRVMNGTVVGTNPGDSVEVWFEGDEGGVLYRSDPFTYRAVSETNNRVLVVAAEDRTGASTAQAPGSYAGFYVDAVADAGYRGRRLRHRRQRPHRPGSARRAQPLRRGALVHRQRRGHAHGRAVPGNADRLALDQMLEARAYMNEGGRVLYTGKQAGFQFSPAAGNQFYDPKGEIACAPTPPPGTDPRRCLLLPGLGRRHERRARVLARRVRVRGERRRRRRRRRVRRQRPRRSVRGPGVELQRPRQRRQPEHRRLVRRDERHPAAGRVPAVRELAVGALGQARRAVRAAPGTQYVYSQLADVSYKRLTREIAVPAGGGNLTFWTSYDTESHWDHLFVEARTAGGDDWTTLPDANGTPRRRPATAGGRVDELHRQLERYVTWDGDSTCTPVGSAGGQWHAASGNSAGWQQWTINVGAYAGQTVEISIAYASDWSVQNLGVFLDDIAAPDGTSTSFEAGFDGWAVTGPPPGSGPNANNWTRTDSSGFPVGSAISTPDSLLMGFGFEGISTCASREVVMERILGHLLD